MPDISRFHLGGHGDVSVPILEKGEKTKDEGEIEVKRVKMQKGQNKVRSKFWRIAVRGNIIFEVGGVWFLDRYICRPLGGNCLKGGKKREKGGEM
jgi:hypothetical protein